LLVSRLGWLDILFNKVAERAKETKSLNTVKARVLHDIKNWSLEKDVFKGNFPWMRSARDTNEDVLQAMKRKLAQRLRDVYSDYHRADERRS